MKKILFAVTMGLALSLTTTAQRSMPQAMQKLLNAEYAISSLYVDTVNEDKLVEDAIKGMLENLDPHSSYTDAKETKELEEPLQGEFSGVGIQFNMNKDTLYVIQTVPGGPSERVGVLAGDRIIYVNDTVIAGVKMKNSDIQKRLRGKKGTNVTIKVKRPGVKDLITFRITRDNIPLHSIDAQYMLDERTGYLRISRFGAKTHEEMMDALKELKKQGMTQLIMDLNDNGGGYLNAAIDMCNEFLDRGQLMVYTEGENSPRNEANANGWGEHKDLHMVVMVNQYSASAAEIFAGAMQDWDRAVIVGRRTFGKGLVQRPFKFEDGSMMRLTVARYYTPSGRCIQKPYNRGDKKAYEKELLDRANEGEFYCLDSIQINDTVRYTTRLNHRTIYGGGGVMPDVFVPVDTSEYSTYYRDLTAKGIINQYAIKYVDKNRKAIAKQFKTVKDFDRGFTVSDEMMKDFIAMGENDSIKYDEEKYRTSERLLKDIIKGLIARDTYGDQSAYSVIINHRNHDLQAAYEVLNDRERYDRLLREGNPEYERLIKHDTTTKKD
ncbi:MAG: S41 family peptidase [Muribaculaceae bacterium]|nr:S41 family peptidase [Muribaculaceae bacterium]